MKQPGAVVGAVIVIVAFPWLSIVAPGSRMKVRRTRDRGGPCDFQSTGDEVYPVQIFGGIACDVEAIIRAWRRSCKRRATILRMAGDRKWRGGWGSLRTTW